MQKFTNSLDGIRIASPCAANWNEMLGDARQRHCTECKLNVYNLSDMTQTEAENFLINSEGRVCLQVYRRNDGTILTQNCPVGWQAMKKRASRIATAVFALMLGVFSGILSLETLKSLRSLTNYQIVPEPFFQTEEKKNKTSDEGISFGGMVSNLKDIKTAILKNQDI